MTEMRLLARLYLVLLLWAGCPLWAQAGAPARFEVAVIKPEPDCALGQNGGGRMGQVSPGRIEVLCTTMWNLIGGAYAVDEHLERRRVQLEGGPRWLKSETFRVTAKAENGTASISMMMGPMLRALLEERLALKTHGETREGAVYELTAGKGGLKAKESVPGACLPSDLSRPPQDVRPNSDSFKNCGIRNLRSRGGMVLEATGVTMSEFAKSLPLEHETINRTGIEGRFDFVLRYSNESTPVAADNSAAERSSEIFTAIANQLGLRIAPARGPVQIVIIDSVQRPSEN
jgi:uncharacterized protein (TIGR03435 family)